MKILVVSDTHANFIATKAVFAAAEQVGFDTFVHLGDVVGYGAMPNEVCELIQAMIKQYDGVVLAGNHDVAVRHHYPMLFRTDFNKTAFSAIKWTTHALSSENVAWLKTLPLKDKSPVHGLAYVHGSPFEPTNEYVTTGYKAAQNMRVMAGNGNQFVFNGHTHRQVVYECTHPIHEKNNARTYLPEKHSTITFKEGGYYLCNAGSVGQPRETNQSNRACFAIFDSSSMTWAFHQKSYDVEAAVQAQLKTSLPKSLAERLREGT